MAQIQDDKFFLITKAGLDKLKEELEYLRNVRRKEVSARIKEAISYGDLSENSEYEDAKNDQAFAEGRIAELEEKIKYAKLIDETQKRGRSVQLGSTVILKPIGKKKENEEYTIVGTTEANPLKNKISNESPVGRAILDKRVGEVVKVQSPSGPLEYEIVSLQ